MRTIITLTTALLLALLAFAAPKPPNVILVMTDDQGHGELACHGNAHLKTPNLGETTDLVRVNKAKVAELSALMDRYIKDTGALYPKPNPAYRPKL